MSFLDSAPGSPSDIWDNRYSAEGFAYGTEPNDFLRENSFQLKKTQVLSLAEGEGRNAVYLASLGYRVLGIDSSKVACNKTLKFAESKNLSSLVKMHCEDLLTYVPQKEFYDSVVLIFCHLPETLRQVVHTRAAEALKAGGTLLLEAYTPRQLEFKTGGPPSIELLYTLDELKKDFAGLNIIFSQEIERDINEGRLHKGKSAVVQFIARKPSAG